MMVDISSKEDIGRYAEAIALSSTDRPDVCVQAAVKAVKNAYRYIPLLHPIPLQAAAHCNAGEIRAEAWTRWKTGVEMDALFGALVGAIASGSTEIKRLFVTLKVKGTDVKLDEGAAVEVSSITRPEVGYIARASGYIHLKSIDIIKQGRVEKGDPICAAKIVVPLSAKRLCELLPVECLKLEYANSRIEFVSDGVYIEAVLKARDASPSLEALFSVGTALLTIWDMVKKYEKDERGQYPDTYVELSL